MLKWNLVARNNLKSFSIFMHEAVLRSKVFLRLQKTIYPFFAKKKIVLERPNSLFSIINTCNILAGTML